MPTFHQQQIYYSKCMEEILEQPIGLNPHTKLSFSSNNPYFYSIPTKNITDKLIIIRNLCQMLQSGLISYTRFEWKLVHSSQWLKVQNWKNASQKSLSKIFCFNNSNVRKIKSLQKYSNKEIHITIQSNNRWTLNTNSFSLFHRLNFTEGFQNLSPGTEGKILTD